MSRQVLFEDERGFLVMEGNELTVGSKIDDPPKVRLTSPIYSHGGGGGCISFDKSRQEGQVCSGSDQTEMALLRVEQAEDVRGDAENPKAEFNFLQNDGSGTGDSAMRKSLAFVWNLLTKLSFAIGGSRSDTIWSPNGLYFTQIQDDGNLVKYQASEPFSKANATPLWWD